MKKVLILLSIASLMTLSSCYNKENSEWNTTNSGTNLETNTNSMTQKQWPVQAGDDIAVHYRGTLEDGTQFDSSYDRWETLPFTVGAGQMIKWFDEWVVGMNVWEKKTLTLTPEEAYWEYSEEAKQVIPKADLSSFTAAWFELKVWEKIPTQVGELEIIEADEENVTLDMNHPLAWKTLTFEVELVEIK